MKASDHPPSVLLLEEAGAQRVCCTPAAQHNGPQELALVSGQTRGHVGHDLIEDQGRPQQNATVPCDLSAKEMIGGSGTWHHGGQWGSDGQPLGNSWKPLRNLLGTSGEPLQRSWNPLGTSWELLAEFCLRGPRGVGGNPLCDIPSGCCSFTGPWTVTRSSLRMLRRVATFCRPLRPVLLLVSFPRSRSPIVGVLGLC